MEIEYTRPWLYPEQLRAIFNESRYSVIEASTKSGKTVGCLAWIVEGALGDKPHYESWWLAPFYSQAQIAFRRLCSWLSPAVITVNLSDMRLKLPNGATIAFKSAANPDALYGENVRRLVVDEAARVKEAAWHAARTTLTATQGPVRIIGNVRGRRNWAYRLAREAEARMRDGTRSMEYHKITAADAVRAGIVSSEEIEDAKRTLPDQIFRELYLAEPSEDAGNPFGEGAILRCVQPMSKKPPVIWGWDLAKHVDWTVGVALDEDGAVCKLHRFQCSWAETRVRIAQATGRVEAVVDASGVGDPIVEDLQAFGLNPNYISFVITSKSKQQLMEGLAVAIQKRTVFFPEGVLLDELLSFEYIYRSGGTVTYDAPEGEHDDCVIALALAVIGCTRMAVKPEVWV